MRTITLDVPKNVVIQEELTQNTGTVNLLMLNDNPNAKKITAMLAIGGKQFSLVLWEGASYDTIGNWTQTQAENKIKELV